MGEMYISRLATPIERFLWREVGLKPLWVVGVVELDVKERGGEALELLVTDEVFGTLSAEDMLSLLFNEC